MNSHEPTRDQLIRFVLGELSEPQRSEVDAHVGRCDRCRAELGQIEQLLSWAEQRKDLSPEESLHESAKGRLFATMRAEETQKTTAHPNVRRAFAWRTIMTSPIAKLGIAAVVAIAVAFFGLSTRDDIPSDGTSPFGDFVHFANACSAEERLFFGSDIIHIQNEIIISAGSAEPPEGPDSTWLPMCSVKPDGTLRFDQLKLAIEPESYAVTDHSWYDPVTGCFARVLKTNGKVFFANSYDGQSVYATMSQPDGTLQLVGEPVAEQFTPPQSPAAYLGLAAGLKTSLTEKSAQVLNVTEGTLRDGKAAHIYQVGMPDPEGQLTAYWLFKVRDEDSTIAEKEFVVLGQPRLRIRRVLTESVEGPAISWTLEEIEPLLAQPETTQRASVTADMVIPRVTVQHMVERADFETYVLSTKPAWTGAIEITDCLDPASPGGRMFIMTARAGDGRHLVLVQSPTYNRMLRNFVKQGQVVYTAPNGFKVWGGGPQKWYAKILLESARASIKDSPSDDRIGYILESPAGTFPALAINGPISDDELHGLVDSLLPAGEHLDHQTKDTQP